MKCAALRLAMLTLAVGLALPGAAAARVRFGLVAGPQLTELTSRDWPFFGTPETQRQLRGLVGVQVEAPVAPHWSVAGGIEYGEFADRMKWDLRFIATDVYGQTDTLDVPTGLDYRLRVLSVPLRVQWRQRGWEAGAGLEAMDVLDARYRHPEYVPMVALGSAMSFPLDAWHDASSSFRRVGFAGQGVAGREIAVGAHLVRLEARWTEGLTRMQRDRDISQRIRAAQLVLGWLW